MKSTTLRRSNITKEKIKAIEALSKYRRRNYNFSQSSNLPPIKDKEIEILWQNLKPHVHNKEEKSPIVYIVTGFILGAVSMLILTTIVNLSINAVKDNSFEEPAPIETSADASKLTFIPADTSDIKSLTTESYTVQGGDTLESIVIRFYGSYSQANAEKIQKANGLTNPNQIQLGQKLTIPLNAQ